MTVVRTIGTGNVEREVRVASLAETMALSRWHSSDFHSTNTGRNQPFFGAAISSGTSTTVPSDADFASGHPGMLLLRSSTTTNGGYRWQSEVSLRGGAGLAFRGIVKPIADSATKTIRIGFGDSLTTSAHANGAWVAFEISLFTPLIAVACANNGTTTTTSTPLTPGSIWYTIDIVFVTGGVRFAILDDAGAALYEGSITTNVPTDNNRRFVAGIIATEASTTATDIALLDYMGVGPQPLAGMPSGAIFA